MRCLGRAAILIGIVVALGASVVPAFADEAADRNLLAQLGLMRGHLWAAAELTRLQDRKQASLHHHHPMLEIYGGIDADLAARGLAKLRPALLALEQVDEAGGEVATARAAALASIAEIEVAVAPSSVIVIGALVDMLKQATLEYAAAYPQGRLAELEEYQDSMGFVFQATAMFQAVRADLARKDAGATAEIEQSLGELATAWPSIGGQPKAILDSARVQALADRIEAKAVAF